MRLRIFKVKDRSNLMDLDYSTPRREAEIEKASTYNLVLEKKEELPGDIENLFSEYRHKNQIETDRPEDPEKEIFLAEV